MQYALCIIIGYLLGTPNPAALLSRIKNKNLRAEGTGNLGATNTMLVLGRRYGVLVMVVDVLKAIAASFIAKALFPDFYIAGLLAGASSVVGHIFPFYMKFRGGKGLAAFAGMVIAFNPVIFLVMSAVIILLMVIINYSIVAQVLAVVLFPVIAWLWDGRLDVVIVGAVVGLIIIVRHIENFKRIRTGEELKVRDYIKNHLFYFRKK